MTVRLVSSGRNSVTLDPAPNTGLVYRLYTVTFEKVPTFLEGRTTVEKDENGNPIEVMNPGGYQEFSNLDELLKAAQNSISICEVFNKQSEKNKPYYQSDFALERRATLLLVFDWDQPVDSLVFGISAKLVKELYLVLDIPKHSKRKQVCVKGPKGGVLSLRRALSLK